MSEPKRFNFYATIVHHIDGEKTAAIKYHTEPDGLFVSYEDYARLKAEVERLKAEPDALTAYLYADTLRRDDIKTLKAHIERLTKAGDTIIQILCKYVPPTGAKYALMDWRDAKEGKPRA